jgi:hypothetical protein
MARMGDLAGVDDYEPDVLLAPPMQPRPLNMLSDAFYGLGRSLSGPAANPIKPAQDAAYNAFKGATVDPVVEAYNAVKGRMTEDEQRNMLFGAALGLLPMGRGAAKGAMPSGIKVFHSSPHDFERFDPSKIGTGEGAQSYGYGHYFAENPAVSGQGGEYWKQFEKRFQQPESGAVNFLEAAGFDRKKAIELSAKNLEYDKKWLAHVDPEQRSDLEAYIAQRQAAHDLLLSGKIVGPRTYEANLKARPEEFLDWDKALRDQPPSIRSAVQKIVPDLPEAFPGSHFHARVASRPGAIGPVQAAQSLREAGIPGIRYLDQGSRAVTNQPLTSNYVMFPGTEHLIDITKKYAIPTAVLGGLAAQDKYETQ